VQFGKKTEGTQHARRIILPSRQHPLAALAYEWTPPGSWYDQEASAIAVFEMTTQVVFSYRGSWCANGQQTSWESAWRIIGDKGTVTFTVTNTGNVTLNTVSLSDSVYGPLTLPVSSLAPGASTIGTATLTVTQALLNAGSETNIAAVAAKSPAGVDVADTDTLTVPFIQQPSIQVVKTFAWLPGDDGSQVGDKGTFTFTVTNTGNERLTSISVSRLC
jgi:uncharacterized repeat protein (TIGR01451 family)